MVFNVCTNFLFSIVFFATDTSKANRELKHAEHARLTHRNGQRYGYKSSTCVCVCVCVSRVMRHTIHCREHPKSCTTGYMCVCVCVCVCVRAYTSRDHIILHYLLA